jgi:2-C-methyl-D-erythritol 4-phosphate cytidylyltransferase
MGGATPKQYLPLGSRRVIEHSLARLLQHPAIRGAVVAIGADDDWWRDTQFAQDARIALAPGGAERVHSVSNALTVLQGKADDRDWVLVHDAARPCLRVDDIDLLMTRLRQHPVGGLLGAPVHDTMKRTDESGAIVATVAREQLWHAFTPQMFRLGELRDALEQASQKGALVTDEASAMELSGKQPLMVQGHADNIKITRPGDLALAAFYLSQQESALC